MIFFFFDQYLIYTPVSESQVSVDVLATCTCLPTYPTYTYPPIPKVQESEGNGARNQTRGNDISGQFYLLITHSLPPLTPCPLFNIHPHLYQLFLKKKSRNTFLLTSSTLPAPSSKQQTTTHSQQQRLFGRCRQHLSQHQIRRRRTHFCGLLSTGKRYV